MKLSISEIVNTAANLPTVEEKASFLKRNDSKPLRNLLKVQYDPTLELFINEQNIPKYRPSSFPDSYGLLYREYRMLKYLVKGPQSGNVDLERRVKLAYQVLETVDKDDATYFENVLLKRPTKGLTIEAINQAFDGLITIVETTAEKKKGK